MQLIPLEGIIEHLKLYDSFTSSKKTLHFHGGKTRIFLCGPTIYDYCHIGHARIFVLFDVLARFVESKNFKVKMVVTVTDIDPKLCKVESNGTCNSDLVSKRYFDEFLKDLKYLRVNSPALYCRTSDHLGTIIAIIKRLLDEKKAYSLHGNIYLDISKMHSFGLLSHLNRDEMMAMRYDIDTNKRDPRDIILWSTTDHYGLTFNDGILGNGVPSFHIQDTAVAIYHFNGTYDIQGGGKDLIYPHHELQMALLQTLTKREKPVSNWIHIGFVLVDGKKMSKSYGNAVYIRRLSKSYDSNALRLYLLSHHYRQSMEFKLKDLKTFEKINKRLSEAILDFSLKEEKRGKESRILKKFKSYLADDLDTPRALEVMIETTNNVNGKNDVKTMAQILGLRY